MDITRRADLITGINTHFPFDGSVYAKSGVPNQVLIDAIIASGIKVIRERVWPHNAAQGKAFAQLAAAGIKFYATIGDMSYSPEQVASEILVLAGQPWVTNVLAVCGPNECNGSQVDGWATKACELQQAIFTAVNKYPALQVDIVGPVLKHNVTDWQSDLDKLHDTGIEQYCTAYDFHYYPGAAGPITNASQMEIVKSIFNLPLYMSETGWTNADTDEQTAANFMEEAIFRNHLSGIKCTMFYELADEYPTNPRITLHEGKFGIHTATAPKPGYVAIQNMLGADPGLEFPGWQSKDTLVNYMVLSGGTFDYPFWEVYMDAGILVIPPEYDIAGYEYVIGARGNKRYTFGNYVKVKVI